MASKIKTTTSGASSKRSSCDDGGGGGEKHGPWAKKCIKWLSLAKPDAGLHPFDNPKLLSKIVHSTEPNYYNLRNWRLVNRLWHEVTLDSWRSTATLVILPDVPRSFDPSTSKSFLKIINDPQNKSGATMSELLQNIVDPSDPYDFDAKPFQKLKLRGMHMEDEMEYTSITSNAYEIVNVLPRVLDLIGAFVLYVHFEYCKFENTMKIGAFHKLILEKIPFMDKLIMTNCVFKENFWSFHPHLIIRYDYNLNITKLKICGDFPMPLACLLTFIPNISELKVRYGNKELCKNRHYFSNIVIPFANMRKFNKRWFNLTNMDVMHTDAFRMGFNPTNHFRMARLPLQQLSVEISPFMECDPKGINNKGSDGASRINSGEDIIAPMLREHRETLQVFKVFRAPFSGPFPNFPFGIDMEHLKELRIWGNLVENFNFLENMPNLRILYLNTYCFDMWTEMKDLLELEFPYEYQPYQDDIVKFTGIFHRNFLINMKYMTELTIELGLECPSICKLSEWMPHLKIFRSIFYTKTFQCTCAALPNLDELGILYGSEVDNDTITGIRNGVTVNSDNVTSLKNLKRFRMDAYCGKSTLKDSSVYFGFLTLRALQSIQICVSKEMSKKAEEDLKLFVPGPVIFIRNYGVGPHDNYDCCQRNQFLREVIGRIPQPTVASFGPGNCSRGGGSSNFPPRPSPSAGTFPRPSRGSFNFPGPSRGAFNFPGPSRGAANFPGPSRGAGSYRRHYRY